ncbi:uncharacterized protein LOC109596995 isoform X2 [Aethina tumida]|nr:uncharacterized protein LOC109596995 isoform X2 [Aethina tumida]
MEASPEVEKPRKKFCRHPIPQRTLCPWITSQPYPLPDKKRTKKSETDSITKQTGKTHMVVHEAHKPCPSMQESSSHFFYFIRLMQLFPEVHPATLHTVMTLSKNNFFSAVDKLLYAKRCKAMYNKNQSLYKNKSQNRNFPTTINLKTTSITVKAECCDNTSSTEVEKVESMEKDIEDTKSDELDSMDGISESN